MQTGLSEGSMSGRKSFNEQRAIPIVEASLHSTAWTDVHKKGMLPSVSRLRANCSSEVMISTALRPSLHRSFTIQKSNTVA